MVFKPISGRTSELDLFLRKVLIVVGIAVILGLLWLARDVLILIFIAAVLAAGIAPAVRRVQILGRLWFHKRVPRGTAVLVVYFPFLFLVLIIGLLVVPRLVADSRELSAQLPALVEQNIITPLEKYFPMDAAREYLRGGIDVPRSSMFGYVRGAAMAVASVIAVLFMIAYMLMDAERLTNLILLLYPPDVRADRRQMLRRMGNRMSSWLAGQLILSAIIGLATFVCFVLLRIPYALPLAIMAAIGELVPVIGPIVGTAPALVIALLHSKWQFWSVLAVAFLLQKIENYFIAPRVMSRKLSISPLAIFIAFMIGASLLGIIGAIMAIPMAAIIHVTFEEVFVARRERRQDVERAGTLLRRVD